MKQVISWARKIVILLTGVPILVLGIILIPAPGPGLLVCFLGLLVLSLEFEWAKKHRDNANKQLKKIVEKSKERADKINTK